MNKVIAVLHFQRLETLYCKFECKISRITTTRNKRINIPSALAHNVKLNAQVVINLKEQNVLQARYTREMMVFVHCLVERTVIRLYIPLTRIRVRLKLQ